MSDYSSAKNKILERGLKPKKSFGQNFMLDQNVNEKIATAVFSLGKERPVLEIGAGTGSLTEHLLKNASILHAVERDRDLVPILKDHFKTAVEDKSLIIHEADGVRFDISSVFSQKDPGIIVGNLPYHLTSSIIIATLKNYPIIKGAVFLVQKEVATRLAAGPNNKEYGFLTAILNLAFKIERVAHVDKSAFWPVPKIDSSVIKLTTCDQGISQVDDIEKFLIFVRGIFQKRRKKLSTILAGQISKEELGQININPDLRPENLSPNDFLRIYQAL